MKMMGGILALGYYLSIVIFYGTYFAKGMIWLRSESLNAQPDNGITPRIFGKSVLDILLLRRLLVVNDILWLGEWIFHASFVLVILRHLRYFLNPVPQWIWAIQPIGIIAGYVLPAALGYIAIMKLYVEKKRYVSSFNFFLLALIFAMSVTGLLMKDVYHPDIVAVKDFIIRAATFRFVGAPESALFAFHFVMVFILLIKLPTHILAAPLTLIDARRREEYSRMVPYGKKG